MKKTLFFLFFLIFIFASVCANTNVRASSEFPLYDTKYDVNYKNINIKLNYVSKKDNDTFSAVYTDEVFSKPSNEYNHFLAKMSIGMAVSAFELDFEDDEETIASNGSIGDYLLECGFENIRLDDYLIDTSLYTVGSAIGMKTIEANGEPTTLVAVALRGGKYKKEWMSNTNVGDKLNHQGFSDAARLITDRVLSFIFSNPIEDNVKIWISGFSRAAAVSNLTAANLNNVFGKEAVYAYTFATPRGVRDEESYSDFYNNIFNILGASDFIPEFAPGDWGYHRYGVDKYLIGKEFDSRFDYKYKIIQDELKKVGINTSYNVDFNLRIRLMIGLMTDFFDSPEMYDKYLQETVMNFFDKKDLDQLLPNIKKMLENLKKDVTDTSSNRDDLINFLINMIIPVMTNTGYMSGNDNTLTSKLLQLAHEHFQEFYLYEMYYINEEDLFNEETFFDYVLLSKNANYIIKDDLGHEIYYVDNKGNKELSAYAIDNHLDIHVSSYSNYIMLVLPQDINYEVHYKALKNGNIESITVESRRYFSSKLDEYKNSISVQKDDEGRIDLKENVSDLIDVAAYASLLKIDKFGFTWQVDFIILLVIIIAFAYGILVLNQFIYCFIRRKPFKFNRYLLILSIFALSFLEAEFSYWLLPDLIYISIIWKLLSLAAIIVTYCIGTNIKNILRKPFDYLLIPIVLLGTGNILSSTYANIATYIVYVLAIISLIIYMIRTYGVDKNLWKVFGILTGVFLLIGIPFYKYGIGYMLILFIPAGIALLLLSIDKKMKMAFANYCLVAAMIFLSINYAGTKLVMSHTIYEALIYIALLLFALSKIDVNSKNIEELPNDNVDEISVA